MGSRQLVYALETAVLHQILRSASSGKGWLLSGNRQRALGDHGRPWEDHQGSPWEGVAGVTYGTKEGRNVVKEG